MTSARDLVQALLAGDGPRITALLRERPALAGDRPATGPSPLLAAAYSRNPDFVAAVLQHVRCDVHEAAALGDVPAIEAVLDSRPADISAFSGDGWTPLHLAAFFGHAPAVSLLLARGASPRTVSRGPEANYPLHAALAGADSAAVIHALLDAGADASAAAAADIRPLHIAASRGDRRTVDALLERGADPRSRTTDGRTASAIAAERQFPELAEYLRGRERNDDAR